MDTINKSEKEQRPVVFPEDMDLPWFLQDYTDAYTNIIRPVNDPSRILFTTTQNPLREVRKRAEYVVEACNNYHSLRQENQRLREALSRWEALGKKLQDPDCDLGKAYDELADMEYRKKNNISNVSGVGIQKP